MKKIIFSICLFILLTLYGYKLFLNQKAVNLEKSKIIISSKAPIPDTAIIDSDNEEPEENNNKFEYELYNDTQVSESYSYKNYKIKIFLRYMRDDQKVYDLPCYIMQIFKNKEVVYTLEAEHIYIGLVNSSNKKNFLVKKIGKDITGDGKSDLVISTYGGGSHGPFNYYIFQIDKEFKLLDSIDAGSGDLAYFDDVDKDGALEYIGADWCFSYWNSTFGGSPAPDIVLKFKDGKYRIALDLMKKPLPNPKKMKENLKELEKKESDHWSSTSPSSFFAECIIDLIYSGHPKEAVEFFHNHWPTRLDTKLKKEFCNQLITKGEESLYWDSISKIIPDEFYKY